jgi:hypothetical protein
MGAAAAYYGAAAQAPMGPAGLHHPGANPTMPPPLIDPQAMALLFGGMNLAGPPLSPAAAAAMGAGGAMPGTMHHHHQQLQMNPFAMAAPGGMTAAVHQAGMIGPAGLGPPSPLGQPGMHPNAGMHSPQPPF